MSSIQARGACHCAILSYGKSDSDRVHYHQIFHLLYYAETSLRGSIRPGNTAPFEKMLQRWRAVGNTVSDLTGPRFKPPAPETNALPLDQPKTKMRSIHPRIFHLLF